MTDIEAQATGGFGDEARSPWSQILVPIVAAALVLALGLVFVSLTTEAEPPYANPPAAEAGVF